MSWKSAWQGNIITVMTGFFWNSRPEQGICCRNTILLHMSRIGEGSVIGAGSVVTKDVPPDSLAVGNPCRVIRNINQEL